MSLLFQLAYLSMWATIAAFAGTCVVLGKYPVSRRRTRLDRRMSRVVCFLGVITLTLFICALMYV